MILAAEQTQWTDGNRNGVYLLSNDRMKMYAFAPYGSNDLKFFKHPISISVKGRKFLVLDKNDDVEEQPGTKVTGSNGTVYYVHEGHCTCPGFKFRGTCKHVTEAL